MKKILLLFVSTLVLGLTSCSKDDDSSSDSSNIEGRWEYFQEGTIVGGTETLVSWDHECTTKKDYVELLSGGVMKDMVYWDDCIDDVVTGTWSKVGKNLTLTLDGETETAKIEKLNSSTLKVSIDYTEDGVTYKYIQVFKRK